MSEVEFFKMVIGLGGGRAENLEGILKLYSNTGDNFFTEINELYEDFEKSGQDLEEYVKNFEEDNNILDWNTRRLETFPSNELVYKRCKNLAKLYSWNTDGILKKIESNGGSPLEVMNALDEFFYEPVRKVLIGLKGFDDNFLKKYSREFFRYSGNKLKNIKNLSYETVREIISPEEVLEIFYKVAGIKKRLKNKTSWKNILDKKSSSYESPSRRYIPKKRRGRFNPDSFG